MGVGGQRHRPGRLEKDWGTNCTGGWVGYKAGLDGRGKSGFRQDLIHVPSSRNKSPTFVREKENDI
jgi:hypothetical protein